MKTKIIKEVITYKKTILPKKEQKEILSKVIRILKPLSKNKHVETILIYGSLSRMELGRYDKEYHGRLYSDIDILVIADKKIKIKKFKENLNLPKEIKKVTKKVCYRYSSNFKIDNKYPVFVHVFNKKIHNKKLAMKNGLPIKYPNRKSILVYRKN